LQPELREETMREGRYALILSTVAIVIALGALMVAQSGPRYTPGTPIRRSLERVHKTTSPAPGPFWSSGYTTFLKDVPISDLFDLDPTKPLLDHSTARFTHVEQEQACHLYTIPSDFGTLPLPTPLIVPGSLPDYPVITTTVRARQKIYYIDTPAARNWENIKDFQQGTEVAVYDLVDETDSIDPIEGIAVGNLVGYLRNSVSVTLKSGKTFDFADFGDRLYAEFHFQTKPIAVASVAGAATTATGALGAAASGAPPGAPISHFRDSGVWMTMPAIGPVPTPGVGPCPP
jgi:hypothetical protein